MTIDEAIRFVVGRRLKADFDNGESYYQLQGTPLELPSDVAQRPAVAALAWHRQQRFPG